MAGRFRVALSAVCAVALVGSLAVARQELGAHAPSPGLQLAAAAGQTDCGCVGAYASPKVVQPGVTAVAEPDANGYSKKRTYQVISGGGGLSVIRVADGSTVLNLATAPASYGFSPDENRFVAVSTQAMTLYDLAHDGAVLHQSVDPQDEDWGFSAHGSYLSAFSLPNQVPTVQVFNAKTGAVVDLDGAHSLTGFEHIGFSSNEDSLLAYSASGAKLYRLSDGSDVYDYDGPPAAYGFSPVGGYLEIKTVTNTTHVDLIVVATADGHTAYEDHYDFQIVPYSGADSDPGTPTSTGTQTGSGTTTATSTSTATGTSTSMSTATATPTTASATSTASATPTSTAAPKKGKGKSGGPVFQEEASGFSPDGKTFLDAYVNDDVTATLSVVNLRDGSRVYTDAAADRATTWSFAPCGGELAVVTPNDNDQSLTLYSTADGRSLGSADVPFSALTIKATGADNVVSYVDVNGTVQTVTLAPNLWCSVGMLSYDSVLFGGDTGHWKMTLDRPAHDYGVTLRLSSNSPALTGPASITVPAGQTAVAFDVSTTPTAKDIPVVITLSHDETLGGTVKNSYDVTVGTMPVAYVDLDQSQVVGAASVGGTVTLADVAPATGTVVTLTSDDPAVTVPETVTVPAGQYDAPFTATVQGVTARREVTITAASGATSVTTTLDLMPLLATTTTLQVTPPGGAAVQGEAITVAATLGQGPDANDYDDPTGTLTLSDGTSPLQSFDLSGADIAPDGTITFSYDASMFAAGTHQITAAYSGDAEHQPSQDTTTITVSSGLTWTGGGDGSTWSDPANWDGDRVPVDGDLIVIASNSALAVHDDLPGLTIDGLHLSGPVTVDGAAFTLAGDLSATSAIARVHNAITLAAGQRPVYSGDVLHLDGVLSGPGGLTVTDAPDGFVAIGGAAANTFTGPVTIRSGADLLAAGIAPLGAVADGQGVVLRGTLCVAPGATVADPITSDGGRVAGCDDADALDAAASGLWDGPSFDQVPPPAALTGPITDDGGLSFGPYLCYQRGDAWNGIYSDFGADVALVVDGAISGGGTLDAGCAPLGDGPADGDLTFGGTQPNTFSAAMTFAGRLALAKSDGVIAVPGDLTGTGARNTVLELDADGQLGRAANIDVRELALGSQTASVGSLNVGTFDATINKAATGRIDVTSGLWIGVVHTKVVSDPAIGTALTIAHRATVSPDDSCPDSAIVRGDAATDFRLACPDGAGDVTLTSIWHTRVTLTADPPDGAGSGTPVTFNVSVQAPSGATTATGPVSLDQYYFNTNWNQWVYRQTLTSGPLNDGKATFSFADNSFLSTGNAFVAAYLGDSLHAPASAPLTRYLAWSDAPAAPFGAPPNLAADPSGPDRTPPDSVYLSWSYPSGGNLGNIASYHITVTPQGGQPYVIDTNAAADDNSMYYQQFPAFPFYRVEGMTPGQTYTFTVAAVNSGGVGAESDPVTVTIPGGETTGPPAAPTSVGAAAGPAQAFLTWTAPADTGGSPIDHYIVTPYIGATAQGAVITSGDGTSATVAGLLTGVAYTFTVTAVNSSGDGPASEPSAAVTPTAAPQVTSVPSGPTNFTHASSGQRVDLGWSAPDSDGGSPLTGYLVRSWLTRGFDYGPFGGFGFDSAENNSYWVAPDATAITVQTDTISWPATGGTYSFDVAAANGIGIGPSTPLAYADAVWVPPASPPGSGGGLPPCGIGTVPVDANCSPILDGGDGSNRTGTPNGSAGSTDANGFAPGEDVTATLHSQPIDLGTVAADANGSVHVPFSIPADLAAGDHTITLVGAQTGREVDIPLRVVQLLTVDDLTRTSFTLGWPDGGADVTGYTITVDGATVATVPAGTTSSAVSGVSAGATHLVAVHAQTADGELGQLATTVTTPQELSIDASVQPSSPSYGDGVTVVVSTTPSVAGSATVSEDGTVLGAATTDGTGVARVALSGLHAGSHALDVSFAPAAGGSAVTTTASVTVAKAATTLRIDRPSSLSDLLALLLGRYRARAHLADAAGTPIVGQPVTLATWYGPLCTAITDADGTATCPVPGRLSAAVLLGAVDAAFAGSSDYLPSSAGPTAPRFPQPR